MFFKKRKPSEDELQRAILRGATIARSKEMDTSKLTTLSEIQSFLSIAFRELKVKPNREQIELAVNSVNALLMESEFVNEAVKFMVANPGANFPSGTKQKMIAAIKKSVQEFQDQNQ